MITRGGDLEGKSQALPETQTRKGTLSHSLNGGRQGEQTREVPS